MAGVNQLRTFLNNGLLINLKYLCEGVHAIEEDSCGGRGGVVSNPPFETGLTKFGSDERTPYAGYEQSCEMYSLRSGGDLKEQQTLKVVAICRHFNSKLGHLLTAVSPVAAVAMTSLL